MTEQFLKEMGKLCFLIQQKQNLGDFLNVGASRTKSETIASLKEQLAIHLRGAPSNASSKQTLSGVKDKYFSFFADQLSGACAQIKSKQAADPKIKGTQYLAYKLKEIFDKFPVELFNPLLHLAVKADLSGLNEEQFNRGLGFVGNGHGLRISYFLRAPKVHALRLVRMKWWPVLDSELDISVHDDDATGVTDDGEGFDLKGTMGKEGMEKRVPADVVHPSQVGTNLQRVEVEQERFPGLALPPPDVSDPEPLNGVGGHGETGQGGRGPALGVASPHPLPQQNYSPITIGIALSTLVMPRTPKSTFCASIRSTSPYPPINPR
ncbi:MAG: hypothetical protein NXY57DRAFT_1070034 [Lentinula lateritia]|nr:MAG: hypothetical protein NXY57DRAFT_1070034 [Lentinula lateritia]